MSPIKKHFALPPLDPASLAGYRVDPDAKKRFERRFRLPALIGFLLIFGAPVGLVASRLAIGPVFALVTGGFAIVLGGLYWMFKSAPVSSSGRRMSRFWSTAAKPGWSEAVYVCEESKTYFIRVWAKPSQR